MDETFILTHAASTFGGISVGTIFFYFSLNTLKEGAKWVDIKVVSMFNVYIFKCTIPDHENWAMDRHDDQFW